MNFRIKEIRMSEGLTQQELADMSGVSRATIAGLESGKITVTTTKTLIRIAHSLNREVSDIFSKDNV